ncbi:hypothetical protein SLH49_21780 [Cognatiyoonia sp. IB215446]|uniref:hypothetical protein n=1 Tax=Cognatiyoonia sp. IB215446 TaxID=3097355 RepID=UPI002A104BF2|nr:hypothetical protein [Cognatiyoonia sp. IB215446]MDX8350629.1 hypothetical protein [Cognatiyoonia sp. IB215446]
MQNSDIIEIDPSACAQVGGGQTHGRGEGAANILGIGGIVLATAAGGPVGFAISTAVFTGGFFLRRYAK